MTFRNGICAALAVALAAPALAAPVQLTTRIMKEQRSLAADGTAGIRLVPAVKAIPGDRLVYILAYRNNGTAPVADLVLDNPLPPSVAYRAPVPGSPVPELSVDGVRFGPLATLSAHTPQGGVRSAGPDDVRHVRWHVPGPVPAGGQGQVSFRAALK